LNSTIALLLMLFSLLALIVGLINPKWVPFSWMKGRRLRVLAVWGATAVAFFVLFGIKSDEERRNPTAVAQAAAPAKDTAPPSVAGQDQGEAAAPVVDPGEDLQKKLSKISGDLEVHVVEGSEGSYRVNMGYRRKSTWSDSSYVISMAETLRKAGETAKKNGLSIEQIEMHAFGPTVDAYGNEGMSKFFILTITSDDFKKVNWENILPQQLLNLAVVQFQPVGVKVATKYCRDSSSQEWSSLFCRKL